MSLKLKVENKTIFASVLFLSLIMFFLGLGKMGVINLTLKTTVWSGLFLLFGSLIVVLEKTNKGFDINKLEVWDYMIYLVVLLGFILGIFQVLNKPLSPSFEGVAGLIYVLIGLFMTIELFK